MERHSKEGIGIVDVRYVLMCIYMYFELMSPSPHLSTEQRIKNHSKDMNHSHLLESKLKAEMSVKPSALWQHRPVSQDSSTLLLYFRVFAVCKDITDNLFLQPLCAGLRHDCVLVERSATAGCGQREEGGDTGVRRVVGGATRLCQCAAQHHHLDVLLHP